MGAPAPVPGVSPALQAVLGRALEKDPARRYGSAGETGRRLPQGGGAVAVDRVADVRAAVCGTLRPVCARPGIFRGVSGTCLGQPEIGRRVHGGRPGPDRLHPARHPPVRRRLRPAARAVPDNRRALPAPPRSSCAGADPGVRVGEPLRPVRVWLVRAFVARPAAGPFLGKPFAGPKPSGRLLAAPACLDDCRYEDSRLAGVPLRLCPNP